MFLTVAGTAHAVSFTNPAPITITDATASGASAASPYPSTIAVSGVVGSVVKVTPLLRGFHHTDMQDVDILLVSPSGQKTILISDAGSQEESPFTPIDLAFDDSATPMPCGPSTGPQPVSGTYAPTDYDPGTCGGPNADSFPAPAPAGPYPHTLAPFAGQDPNGTWQLYVVDQYQQDSGAIDGGWTLDFQIPPATLSTSPGITGKPEVGRRLTAVSGVLADGLARYQWNRCNLRGRSCKPIRGATSGAYKPVKADRGHRLAVTETAAGSGGSSTPRNSRATAPVGPAVISTKGTQGAQRALARKGVIVSLASNVGGRLTATGTIALPGARRALRLRGIRKRRLAAARRTTVKLRLPSGAAGAIRSALAAGRRIKAKVTLTVVDQSRVRVTKRLTIKLRP